MQREATLCCVEKLDRPSVAAEEVTLFSMRDGANAMMIHSAIVAHVTPLHGVTLLKYGLLKHA
jgi:hypothetical protein